MPGPTAKQLLRRASKTLVLERYETPCRYNCLKKYALAKTSTHQQCHFQGLADEPQQPRRRKPPSHTDNSDGSTSGRRDFVHQNIVDAGTRRKSSATPADGDDASKFLQKSNYGQVPTYLHERKMELAADHARQQV